MKSIQTKFIVLILGCILLSSSVIGGAGILNAKHVVDEDSVKIMNLMCKEKTQEINALLSRIQQSVKTLAVYSIEQLESVERLKTDSEYINAYTQKLEAVAVNAASNTEGAMAVYVRFNPEFTPPTSGLFWSKTTLDGSFRQHLQIQPGGYRTCRLVLHPDQKRESHMDASLSQQEHQRADDLLCHSPLYE